MAKRNLGDIVTMPLPTQWAPAPQRGTLPPGSSSAQPIPGPGGGAWMAGPGGGLVWVPNGSGPGGGGVGPGGAGAGVPQGYVQGPPGSLPGLTPGTTPQGLFVPPATAERGAVEALWRPGVIIPNALLPEALRQNQDCLMPVVDAQMCRQLDAYPVLDGFLFSSKLKCDLQFRSLAVDQFEALRRTGVYKQKQWLIPESAGIPIPARDSYEIQLDLGIGAAIWGFSFVGVTNTSDSDSGRVLTQGFQVRDGCTDEPLFSEPNTQQATAVDQDGNPVGVQDVTPAGPLQQVLAKLLIIGAPGVVTVEIMNQFSTDQTAQLILYGGVPLREDIGLGGGC